MIIGPGTAIIGIDVMGTFGIAFAFGFALLAMAYTIGHVSGCHINPAVTLGFLLSRKITPVQSLYYWVAQFVGAAIGGLIIYRHHQERRPRQDDGRRRRSADLRRERVGRQDRQPVRPRAR